MVCCLSVCLFVCFYHRKIIAMNHIPWNKWGTYHINLSGLLSVSKLCFWFMLQHLISSATIMSYMLLFSLSPTWHEAHSHGSQTWKHVICGLQLWHRVHPTDGECTFILNVCFAGIVFAGHNSKSGCCIGSEGIKDIKQCPPFVGLPKILFWYLPKQNTFSANQS